MKETTPPTVYQSHPITGEYVGSSPADQDPLFPENWLIPGGAFFDEPPKATAGYVAVHIPGSSSTWQLVRDLRGTVYSKADGSAVIWGELGPLPEFMTEIPRPGPYHVWAGNAWSLDENAEIAGESAKALAERDKKLSVAAIRIAPLQDAVDLGEETADEEVALRAWKKYRVALNRIAEQEGFPKAIEWPLMP